MSPHADDPAGPLAFLHPPARGWFDACFEAPTQAQAQAWPAIARGESTLLLAPTGSGKTLAAFLAAIDRLMFAPEPEKKARCRVLYVSPIKALGVDVERNLRAPLAGIVATADRMDVSVRSLEVGVRSGDTPQNERARLVRRPPDILITTPESLYLMLTSRARETLRSVETVIIDEIHSLVGTKRGTHLFLSLERLEAERAQGSESAAPLQRIGLSATQRPLEEVARLLGGFAVDGDRATPRPVTIVDAGRKKELDLRIEVPVEDMTDLASDPTVEGTQTPSIWPSIHPRLVELIREHRSTMIFTNSRRLSERLVTALNELAGEPLAMAHHGSLSKEVRADIEDRLKRGDLPAIVATSSLELGIDMGAVDLVIQLEAPPSIASGLQRIGRAGHSVGAVSRGVVLPKYRGDLLACAAAVPCMLEGAVEATFYPRNPLDVLAQQIVAMVAMEDVDCDTLYDRVRGAAPYAELPRGSLDGVLDMLSGRYPSDDFAELRPRVTWDRVGGQLSARRGARRTAVINGGTIPDRGLYGVFLVGDGGSGTRVGELDEEMVFESRVGEVFLLGASSWRIEEITHDRVLVTPAPGEPGRMPFWHGDRPGRPLEFGRAIGALTRAIAEDSDDAARSRLHETHLLDGWAADNLLAYVRAQQEATDAVPSDRCVVVERFLDEVGDWRICVLTPFGGRVHAAWATAVMAMLLEQHHVEIDMMWTDDGMVFRMPEGDVPPGIGLLFPAPEEVEPRVVRRLAETSLFAARFRENAGRALLLTRRRAGQRTPLWALRRRSQSLLQVAAQFRDFPIVLETYRECLRDVFDLPGTLEVLRQVQQRAVRVVEVETRAPSPFAAAVLFTYVGNFMYEGDAPLAERRAQALTIDHAQLRQLLGEAALRELLDPDAIEELVLTLQRRRHPLKHADAVHDLLLVLGDLGRDEILERAEDAEAAGGWLDALVGARRLVRVKIAGERRYIAAEDAGRYRDALGVVSPPGLPVPFLEATPDPLAGLLARYARTHGPFTARAAAARFGVGVATIEAALRLLVARDKIVEGEFLPRGSGREWCDADVLRRLKRMSLARLRQEVEPVSHAAFGRFITGWHGLDRPATGLDALLDVIEQLQGAPIPAAVLESEVLPARLPEYRPGDLDTLLTAGELVWRGFRPLGPTDGRIGLYLADHYAALAPPASPLENPLAEAVRAVLVERGASFFGDIARAVGRFPGDVLEALWDLVWAGEATNDTISPLRSRVAGAGTDRGRGRDRRRGGAGYRSRRAGPPGSEGRWTLLPTDAGGSPTERRAALTRQLLARHGVLTREAVAAEGVVGGFSAVYPVLKAMEEAGRIRRGYFTAGLGATQFAQPGADDRLRDCREPSAEPRTVVLAATDPANPYGAALPWPAIEGEGGRLERASGARVILRDGRLVAFVSRSDRTVTTALPEDEPRRAHTLDAIAEALAAGLRRRGTRAVLVGQVDGQRPHESVLAEALKRAGFQPGRDGYLLRRGERTHARR